MTATQENTISATACETLRFKRGMGGTSSGGEGVRQGHTYYYV